VEPFPKRIMLKQRDEIMIRFIDHDSRDTGKQMFDFEPCPCDGPPDRALRRRSHARRIRLWRGVTDFTRKAPAPVIAVQRSETNIGGAGNVARNITSLGARLHFCWLIGDDDAGSLLKTAAGERRSDRNRYWFVTPRGDDAKGAFRLRAFLHPHAARGLGLAQPAATDIEQKLIDAVLPLFARADIVLLSDYPRAC